MKQSTKEVFKKLDHLYTRMDAHYKNAIYNGHLKQWYEFKKCYILEIADIFAIAKTQAALNKIIEINVEMLRCDDDIREYFTGKRGL